MIGDDDLSNELFEDEIETPFTSDKRINYEDCLLYTSRCV